MKRGRNQRRRQGANPNRALDSNGPDVRIRGTANQIYDKYQALARDASSSGDRVKAESYLQHAEHYFRLIRSMQTAQQLQQPSVQPTQTDTDSEQPAVDEDDNQTETRRQSPNRSHGASDGATPNAEAESKSNTEEASGADEDSDEARRPRRRRPRRSVKPTGEGDAAESEEPAAAAE